MKGNIMNFEDINEYGCEKFIEELTDDSLKTLCNGFELLYSDETDVGEEDQEYINLALLTSVKLFMEEHGLEQFTEEQAKEAVSLVGCAVIMEKLCRDGLVEKHASPGFLFIKGKSHQEFGLTDMGKEVGDKMILTLNNPAKNLVNKIIKK